MRARGNWWLPDAEGLAVGGELLVGPEGFALELDGTLRTGKTLDQLETEQEGTYYLTPETVLHPVVHGHSNEEGTFTLLDVNSQSIFGPMEEHFEIRQSGWRVGAVLAGEHVERDELAFDRLRVSLDYLADWASPARVGLEFSRQPTDVTLHAATRTMDSVQTGRSDIELVDVATFRVDGRSAELSLRLAFDVSPERPLGWREVTGRWVAPLRDLLTFSTLRPNRADHVRVRVADPEGASRERWGDLTVRTLDWERDERSERARIPHDQLLTLGDVDGGLAWLLPRWFELRETYRPVLALLLGVDYAPFMYGQQRFLAVVQAAEVLHATRHPSAVPIPKEQHHARVDRVMASDIPDEDREWVNETLRGSNWMSLAGRLTDLVNGCSPVVDALDSHGSDVQSLVRAVRDARNALTHEGPGSDRSPLDAAGMFWVSRALTWLVRHHLLQELGLDADRCRGLVERNADFHNSIERAADNL